MVSPSGPLNPLTEVKAVDEVKFGWPMTTLAFIPVVSGGSNISMRLFAESVTHRLAFIPLLNVGSTVLNRNERPRCRLQGSCQGVHDLLRAQLRKTLPESNVSV